MVAYTFIKLRKNVSSKTVTVKSDKKKENIKKAKQRLDILSILFIINAYLYTDMFQINKVILVKDMYDN